MSFCPTLCDFLNINPTGTKIYFFHANRLLVSWISLLSLTRICAFRWWHCVVTVYIFFNFHFPALDSFVTAF